ncbi:hypothetical protein SARC_13880 [Sphaeroforma arctica JP610]|uniref:Glutathione S-transferase n=1 Tax=Sphaeroforma arctica JP610 TaxID=667725 RepID=A0A0L0FA30_9EUKA|nr:hypothetical protein SARC_13880 [Sphaeroforma arctica JP610]KNC73562.1 hypothetical protein SARC_13880 [Sphaeroforma arctica JP610]|eukprot:XP_014147464.1 hypothetical protein SARC_13880 [Sphaeroforma arctica JP610]
MDGLKLSQSGAIVRYLAAKHGMDGSPDVYHKTQCDIIAECLRDYKADAYGAWEYWLGPDPSPERLTKLQASNGRFLPRFERQLKRNREEDGYIGGFLVGPKLTYADVYASEVLEEVVAAIPEALSAYPLTAALLEQTRAHPGIAAFLSGKDGHRKMINAAEKDIITYRANVDRALGR